MTVVTTIGILAAIAIPSYQGYIVRAKVAEGCIFASSLKPSVPALPRMLLEGHLQLLRQLVVFAWLPLAVAVALYRRRWIHSDSLAGTDLLRVDPETGLSSGRFLRARIARELGRAARQRSWSALVLIEPADGSEASLQQVGHLLRGTSASAFRHAGTSAGRTAGGAAAGHRHRRRGAGGCGGNGAGRASCRCAAARS